MNLFSPRTLLSISAIGLASHIYADTVIVNESDPEVRREVDVRFGPGADASYFARNGMVTSSSNHATFAGLEILRAGGNAFDAAAAVQMVLCVTEPYASGLGGGLFAMGYDADSGKIFALDGREESPKAFHAGRFKTDAGKVMPFRDRITGGNAVGVPGTLAAFIKLQNEHGSMSLAEICEPAIRIARDGFRVPETFAANLKHHWDRISLFPESRRLFSRPDGSPLQAGDLHTNPELADTLTLIAQEGANVFYHGAIAQDIVRAVQTDPVQAGVLTMEDLARYQPLDRSPVAVSFDQYSVYGMPMPSSGGATLGLMLNLVQAHGLENLRWGDADTFSLLLNIQNLAFADRNHYMADADFVDVPVDGLLDPAYASERVALIQSTQAIPTPIKYGKPAGAVAPPQAQQLQHESQSTTHFSVVDRDRNVISITSTLEQHFGSGVAVPGRGFLLNNELTDFNSTQHDKAGELAANRPTPGLLPRRTALGAAADTLGGKRPRSSMSPTIILKDGQPYLVIGSPGGSRIIGVVFNALLNTLVFDFDLQAAINAPRVIGRNGRPEMESPLYRDTTLRQELKERGFKMVDAQAAGSVQAIRVNPNGWLEGAADPRREGLALGY
ncbi:gamma-glutamyltransferase [Coraliomargarita sp. SDUM461003]|uniref:Glutathione hydrolase proenzyme n=1 Tax=Thalassobacterium maritimum TaxID=3041265 RepID=A0ABU1AZB9_9BACT|nr:gamma-glutamyltransferase [Coraliomargarita sp. SDUM461003]MDQ8208490.1 gamma-glutamyltransferase [Coraliomargarita sp. SDUM461003]